MNRKVFEVVVRLNTRVVGTDTEDVEARTREHIRQHPEVLSIHVGQGEDCELLEDWEVAK